MMELKYAMLFALLLVPMVSAIGGFNGAAGASGGHGSGSSRMGMDEIKGELLTSSMDNVICKADFMNGVLESMMENVNGTENLQDDLDALETDVETLQGYSGSGDANGYRLYLRDSFAPHMRAARENIMSARHGVGGSVGEQLRIEYDSYKSEYHACNDESMGRFSEAKVNAYEAALERAQERADNMSAKGIDASGLDSLIRDAWEQVVDPLQDALDEAENGTGAKDAIHQYCLFNGCKEGLNFHFWVKFEAEKLDSVLASISDEAAEAGLSDDVDSAQADIDSASDALEDAGTAQYTDGAGQGILDDLHSAAQKIKAILHELRSS
jgi:hypothetical protein